MKIVRSINAQCNTKELPYGRIKLNLKTEALGNLNYFQYLFFQLSLVEAKLSITEDKLLTSAKEVTLLISLNPHTILGKERDSPL